MGGTYTAELMPPPPPLLLLLLVVARGWRLSPTYSQRGLPRGSARD